MVLGPNPPKRSELDRAAASKTGVTDMPNFEIDFTSLQRKEVLGKQELFYLSFG